MPVCMSSKPEEAPSRSLVIAAGGGRDLRWSDQRVAAELLAHSRGRVVHLLLHGDARGADAAIARAAHQLGWSARVMAAEWRRYGRAAGPVRNRQMVELAIARAERHSAPGLSSSVLVVAFPGGVGTASLLQQARRMACRSPVPIAVVEVSPAADPGATAEHPWGAVAPAAVCS